MADHTFHFLVHQLLRHVGRGFGVGCIVLAEQNKLGLFAVEHDALRVGLVHCHLRAVLVVFADMGLRAGNRGDRADFHDDFIRVFGALFTARGEGETDRDKGEMSKQTGFHGASGGFFRI